MSDIKLKAASGGGSISLKGPSSAGSDTDFLDTSGNINLLDNQKVNCGDSTDLQIYHSSSSGNNIYQGNSHQFWNAAGNEVLATFAADGKCELYHNGQKCLQTQPDGGVETMDGNFIIGAAGHGIQFDTANSGTDQLLDDYEEGTFTPTASNFTMGTIHSANYTKIGNVVYIQCYFETASGSSSSVFSMGGLPYTVKSGTYYSYGCGRLGSGGNTNSASDIVFEFQNASTNFKPYVQDGNINWGMASATHVIVTGFYHV